MKPLDASNLQTFLLPQVMPAVVCRIHRDADGVATACALDWHNPGEPLTPPSALPRRWQPTGSAFARRVWRALRDIPAGETRSYRDIAREIGQPLAARAVGGAVGRNPFAPFIPCHRVIAQNGQLSGYAFGTAIKAALLAAEQISGNSLANAYDGINNFIDMTGVTIELS
ncbi:methylated-DNA--[protein]-cysteine S-methyltransferase [Halothiobacillus sp. DCM-1]|uniref:methylated-DNA--[protein]-cysteine S-methyltransferase n=1 Tax=Halothiobacillus sp. DCM-1 TaxID=3112558 RepID=UPI0032492BA1